LDTWRRLEVDTDDLDERNSQPIHLLWALLLLKVYGKEEELASLAGAVDEKTFRKWSHIFVEKISYLQPEVVSPFQTTILFWGQQNSLLNLSFLCCR
jgi:hypothetical protein